jgi:hypothetical protein
MKGNTLGGAPLLRGVIAPTFVGEILQDSHVAPRGEDLFAGLGVSEFITPLFSPHELTILQAVPESQIDNTNLDPAVRGLRGRWVATPHVEDGA